MYHHWRSLGACLQRIGLRNIEKQLQDDSRNVKSIRVHLHSRPLAPPPGGTRGHEVCTSQSFYPTLGTLL